MRVAPKALPAPLAAACREVAKGGAAWLVGGAVRDLALGHPLVEVDLVVSAGAARQAAAIARAWAAAGESAPKVVAHKRFRTASVTAGEWRVDVTEARRERYPTPGRLPEVSFPATLDEDLTRRDFTVNALAVRLRAAGGWGEAVGPGVADMRAARGGRPVWRVFHPLSFVDDPTRLFRLARYRGLHGGRLASVTRAALSAPGLTAAFAQVAPARWRAEVVAWSAAGLPPRLRAGRAEERALRQLCGGAWERGVPGSVAGFLAACRGSGAPAVWRRLGAWKRELAALAPLADAAFPGLAADTLPAQADSVLAGLSEVALAVARRGAAAGAVRRWEAVAHRLEMPSGADVLALGVPAGPGVAACLAGARAAALAGEIAPGRQALLTWIRGRMAAC